MIHRGPDSLVVVRFGYTRSPHPPPLPAEALPATLIHAEKERQVAEGKGGGGSVRGVESYDRKKAWSSINHSVLSG
jgi:hypothetical protein